MDTGPGRGAAAAPGAVWSPAAAALPVLRMMWAQPQAGIWAQFCFWVHFWVGFGVCFAVFDVGWLTQVGVWVGFGLCWVVTPSLSGPVLFFCSSGWFLLWVQLQITNSSDQFELHHCQELTVPHLALHRGAPDAVWGV